MGTSITMAVLPQAVPIRTTANMVVMSVEALRIVSVQDMCGVEAIIVQEPTGIVATLLRTVTATLPPFLVLPVISVLEVEHA